MNELICPYCGKKVDDTDLLVDLASDNTIDTICEHCDKEFEVYVEFEPYYYPNKIEFHKCELCGKETRDICIKGSTYPYPKIEESRLCQKCWRHLVLSENIK